MLQIWNSVNLSFQLKKSKNTCKTVTIAKDIVCCLFYVSIDSVLLSFSSMSNGGESHS